MWSACERSTRITTAPRFGMRSTSPRCSRAARASRMRVRGTPNSWARSVSRSLAPGGICCWVMRTRSASKMEGTVPDAAPPVLRARFRAVLRDGFAGTLARRSIPHRNAGRRKVSTKMFAMALTQLSASRQNGELPGTRGEMASAASQPEGPLAGYRVLEMGSTVAGPFCGRLLADFGAEVIKIEAADGDPVRTMGKQYREKSLWAASIFRNKSLIGIDLRKPRGQELVKTLAAKCDFLIENFRPGSLEAWGLGYDELAKINPGLIMVRISGYGQTGPYRERPGYGVICEAVSGI